MTKLASLFIALLVVGTYTSATPAPQPSLELAAPSAAITRTQEFKASRSRPAVIAPPVKAPVKPEAVGVKGVKAVPKPKPKVLDKPAKAGKGFVAKNVSRASGKCARIGVQSNAAALCSAILANFGSMTVGGFRAGAGEHGQGRAVDVMVTGSKGDAIAAFVLANAGQYNVEYIIWQQRYREPGGSWDMMEDRGSPTQNHMDHVHITVR